LKYTEAVVDDIWRLVGGPALTPTPLPAGEGQKRE
jgi:hypothetical protein